VTQVRERLSVDLSVRSLFEHPTLGTFAEHVSGAQHSETVAPVAPTVAQRRYPASFSQQQLFFLDRLRPGMATYNSALAVRVKGELDVDALERSLADVIARHEALRTVLVEGADGPEQVVLDRWEFSVPRVDLTPFPDDVREDELRRRLRETRRPFDLGRDLMLRATLFELGPDERVIAFLAHHVAFDGWSADVFLRDLAELYEARREGRPPSLPELPFQYGDFARQQRDRLRGERLERELDYWRKELAGAPTILPLPSDRPRPARETYDGASLLLSIPGELAGEARRLCQAEGVTPYMLMLAAFGTLLYRATGQDDVLVSGPFANRDRAEFDRLVGFFANTVVTRVRHGGNPSFSTLLGRVRQTVLGAFDHQEVPLDHVVEALAPERRAGFNPLVQVNFRVLAEPPPTLRLRGAATSNMPVAIGLTHFDLALEVHVLAEEISAEFIYKTDLFDRESIARMAADFEALLRQAVARPDTRLLALELPSEQAVPAPAVASPGGIRGFRSSAP
jgi:hypothetical protein